LNHFTVPVGILVLLSLLLGSVVRSGSSRCL
jgi:hypothetical protein